jgi:hypothetical protein
MLKETMDECIDEVKCMLDNNVLFLLKIYINQLVYSYYKNVSIT